MRPSWKTGMPYMLLGPSRRLLLKRCTSSFGAAGSKSNCHTIFNLGTDVEAESDSTLERLNASTPPNALNAYTIPFPAAKKTSSRPSTTPIDGGAQVQ